MKKNLSLILSLVFFSAILVVGFGLYNKIKKEEAFQIKINEQELLIKKKLSLFGQLQKLYFTQAPESNKLYLDNWGDFKKYVDTGKIYVIDRREEIKELYLGKDTSIFYYDTLKIISIKDSIWNKSGFEMRTFSFVPDEDNAREFEIAAQYKEGRSVFEIKDPEPINPARQSGEMDTLRVGSLDEPTTEGNWH